MTGKRFQYNVNKNCIEYDGKFVASLNSIDGCRIANYWNGLYKENEQLRHDATILIQSNQDYRRENEQLLQFKYKVYRVINKRIDLLESDYNQAVKAGMPSNSVYGEIELLEELLEELGK